MLHEILHLLLKKQLLQRLPFYSGGGTSWLGEQEACALERLEGENESLGLHD